MVAQTPMAEPLSDVKPKRNPPPLQAGDHLSRIEFERRYASHPEIKKAELVAGMVYMPSPTRFTEHAEPHSHLIGWLVAYSAFTSGVRVGDNATVIFDFENEVQPDGLLRIEPECGGRSRLTAGHYVEGPPELVIEIAASSAAYDLHTKQRTYQRHGVEEYLVVQIYEQRLDWFRLREGVYQSLVPDEAGLWWSEIFPGLCLHESAFWAGQMDQVLGRLQDSLGSPEHAAFVTRLNPHLASRQAPPPA